METMFDWPSDSDGDSEMKAREQNVYHTDQVTYINGMYWKTHSRGKSTLGL